MTRNKGSKPRVFTWAATIALCAAVARFLPAVGSVQFTGLDDSAQCILARAFHNGVPLRRDDRGFAAVPEKVRPHLLYRPAAHRLTRDLAWQVDPNSFEARPFFQPFLPLQRAFLPGFPTLLALAALALAWRAGGALCAVGCAGAFFATPWPTRFCFGPFAEGPATLLCATGLSLAAAGASGGGLGRAPAFCTGLLLGLGVTFHPTLGAAALPITAFAAFVASSGAALALGALGAALGLCPLVLSTAFVTAPYGNFLHPATLRAMLAGSADIRALGVALATMAPLTALLAAATRAPKLRAAAHHPTFRNAATAAAALAITAALAAAIRNPSALRAIEADFDALAPALPAFGTLLALAIARRRPAFCFLVAALVLSSLPFLAIQGNETNVGIWSLRRSLPPALLVPFAAVLTLFTRETKKCGNTAPAPSWRTPRVVAAAVLAATAAFQIARHPPAYSTGAEKGARELVEHLDARLPDGALCLFERIFTAAPLAAGKREKRDVFGLNDGTANALAHEPVAEWLTAECKRRPVLVVALREVEAPIFDNGVALLPRTETVTEETRRVYGKSFGTAEEQKTTRSFSLLTAAPATSPEAAGAFAAAGATILPGQPLPFGLAPGAWAPPKQGKRGRWACDGAAFFAPPLPPGVPFEVEMSAVWWTSAGTNAPAQRLWLECLGDDGAPVLETEALALAPSPKPRLLRWTIPSPPPAGTCRWRLRAAVPGSERGWPERLAASVESIRFAALAGAAAENPGPF